MAKYSKKKNETEKLATGNDFPNHSRPSGIKFSWGRNYVHGDISVLAF